MAEVGVSGGAKLDIRVLLKEFSELNEATFSDITEGGYRATFASGVYAVTIGEGYTADNPTSPNYPGGTTHFVGVYANDTMSYSISQLDMTASDVARYAAYHPEQIAAELLTGDDRLFGSEGKDYLDGFRGADYLVGYGGNDTYVVDSRRDQVFEGDLGGKDTIIAKADYKLSEGADKEIEIIRVDPNTKRGIDIEGNLEANTLYGNDGANTLTGGGERDTLWGYGGKDTFVFTSPKVTNLDDPMDDRVKDFTSRDQIALTRADYKEFFGGSLTKKEFHVVKSLSEVERDDRIIYNKKTGILYADADGSGAEKSVVIAHFTNKASIGFNDFELVA